MKYIAPSILMLMTATLTYGGLSRLAPGVSQPKAKAMVMTTSLQTTSAHPMAAPQMQTVPLTTVHVGHPATHLAPPKNNNKKSA
jgi:hypothetical protein